MLSYKVSKPTSSPYFASHRGAPSPSAPSTRSTTRAFRSTSGSPFVGVPGAAARCGDSEGCASLLILGMDVPRPR